MRIFHQFVCIEEVRVLSELFFFYKKTRTQHSSRNNKKKQTTLVENNGEVREGSYCGCGILAIVYFFVVPKNLEIFTCSCHVGYEFYRERERV